MSLITSIFCPLCQEAYDEDLRRPRMGKCFHHVCDMCQKQRENPNCAICEKEDAFLEVIYNYQSTVMFKSVRDNATDENLEKISKNPTELSLGRCLGIRLGIPCQATSKLRICVTCGQDAKIFEKHPNGKYRIVVENKAILLPKIKFFCTGCILDGLHGDHQFLTVAQLGLMDYGLEHWNYLVQAKCLSARLLDDRHASGFFKKKILELREELLHFDVLSKKENVRYTLLEKMIKLKWLKYVDIHTVPELSRAKDKVFGMAKQVIDRILKIQERILWTRRQQVASLLDDFGPVTPEHDNDEWKEFVGEMKKITERFNAYKIIDLSPEEAEDLDREQDEKLLEEMQKLDYYDAEDEENLNFFKFKAIFALLEKESENEGSRKEAMQLEMSKCEALFNSRFDRFQKSIIEENSFTYRLILQEIVEETFKCDKLLIDGQQFFYEQLQTSLLWIRSFPQTFDEQSEQWLYDNWLSERFSKGNCAVANEFLFSMFG